MSAVATDTALYTYGVVASSERAVVPTHAAGRELEVVDVGPLGAVTTVVALDEFGEEPLRENLNDRDWLERHARAHEDVLLAVAARTDVVPFRFGTISRTAADLRALLRGREVALVAALERVRGKVEIGIKVWVDEERLRQAIAPRGAEPPTASGRAYLEARRAERQEAADADAFCAELAHEVYDRAVAHAVDGVVNRPQPRELTGRAERMILNAALLVGPDTTRLRDDLDALEERLHRFGVTLELTGPWPPHNFVDGEEEEA
jgi:hypothetical protein